MPQKLDWILFRITQAIDGLAEADALKSLPELLELLEMHPCTRNPKVEWKADTKHIIVEFGIADFNIEDAKKEAWDYLFKMVGVSAVFSDESEGFEIIFLDAQPIQHLEEFLFLVHAAISGATMAEAVETLSILQRQLEADIVPRKPQVWWNASTS